MLNFKYSAATLLLLALTGCGGGGGGSDAKETSTTPPVIPPAPTVLTGIIVDSPVYRMGYRTASGEGFTNEKGEFNYIDGETVTFFIGDTELPATNASSIVTLLDIADTEDYSDQRVGNMARLLQTLDKDGNPNNGIEITEAAQASAPSLDLSLSAADFEATQAVIDFISNAGQDVVVTSLIPLSQAILHLSEQIEKYKNIELGAPGSVVGSWVLTDSPAFETAGEVVLVLTAQHKYFFAEYNNPTDGNDFEYGDYTYADGKLTLMAEINQNTEIGPTNINDSTEWQLVASTDEQGHDTFAFEPEGEVGFVEFTKDSFDGSGISGIWQPTDTNNMPTNDLLLLGGTTDERVYIAMSTGGDVIHEGEVIAQGKVGIEMGSYLYDTSTKNLEFFPQLSTNTDSSPGVVAEVLNTHANIRYKVSIDAATKQLVVGEPKYNQYQAYYNWVETPSSADPSLGTPFCTGLPASVTRKVTSNITMQHHPLGWNSLMQMTLNFTENPISDKPSSYSFNFDTGATSDFASEDGTWSVYIDLYNHIVINDNSNASPRFSARTTEWIPNLETSEVEDGCFEHRDVIATELSLQNIVYSGLGRANRID